MFKKHNSIFNNSKQIWSLRKMSVGLTSVLLGFIFLSGSQTASADTVNGAEVEQSSAVLVQDKKANSQGAVTDGESGTIPKQDDDAKTIVNTNNNSAKTEPQQSSVSATDEQKGSTTTTLNADGVQPQNNNVSLYESKLQGSGVGSKEDVTKNDQEKAKQLTTENINQHILDKYQKMLDESSQDSWINGLPTHEQQKTAEVKNGTKILVDNPGWGPKPLVNNTIVYNGKTYKYIYQNNNGDTDDVSSIYGLATTSAGDGWLNSMGGYNFSNSSNLSNDSDEDINEDYGYRWTKTKDGNIIIIHGTNREEKIVNEGGHQWNIDKEDGHVIIRDNDDDSDEDIDDNFKEFDTDLDIQEALILTPEGNIVHRVRFINEGNINGKPIPLSYYALIDTSMNGKDGTPIYVTANGSLYISNNGMVYGIRKLGDGDLFATDNSSARTNNIDNLGEDISATYGAKYMDTQTPLISNVDDTAIRVSTPVVTLNQGDSVDMWYIETAFPLSALKGKSIGEAVDDQINLPVNEWIKELEKQRENDKSEQNKQDEKWHLIKDADDITSHNLDDLGDNASNAVEDSASLNDSIKDAAEFQKEKEYKNLRAALNDLFPRLEDFIKKIGDKKIGKKVLTIAKWMSGKPLNALSKISDWSGDIELWHGLVFHPIRSTIDEFDRLHRSIRKNIIKLERSLPQLNKPALKKKVNEGKRNALRTSLVSKFNQKLEEKIRKAKSSFENTISNFRNAARDGIVDWVSDKGPEVISKAVGLAIGIFAPEKLITSVVAQAAVSWVTNKINQSKKVKNGLTNLVGKLMDSIWNGKITIGSHEVSLSVCGKKIKQDIFQKYFVAEPRKIEDYVSNMILDKSKK
ncbi:YSIRK-type signal peptide-containing protein [Lactobacillus crispatus]|uniref:YSIRK-type signal peptide-containing protein n=1 Tax=Lactobacillus crispatus TaxID=47770 RepID=UPI003D6BD985